MLNLIVGAFTALFVTVSVETQCVYVWCVCACVCVFRSELAKLITQGILSRMIDALSGGGGRGK